MTFRGLSRLPIVKMMQRPPRLVGLLVSLCLAAFMLVASGFTCIASASSESMAAMGMTSPTAASQTHAQDHAPVQQPVPPCKLPWAPDGCQSMVPCAPAALASSAVDLNRIVSPSERAIADLPEAPTSVTRAPELPPPRA